jgi:UTP--glucose-1-phosphate uridylyltransferase
MAPVHAVIPVAGLATRLLPLTKAQPKAMLALGDRPVIEHVVAELALAGVNRVTIVAAPRDCHTIAAHFAPAPELEALLLGRGRPELAAALARISADVEVDVVAQPQPLGLGDAVLCAHDAVGGEPFALALGDALVDNPDGTPSRITARLGDVLAETRAACAIAVVEVDPHDVSSYGIVAAAGPPDGDVMELSAIVEKPAPQAAPSRLAVAARYACGPQLMDALARCPREPSGELGLTAPLQLMIDEGERVVAVPLGRGERRRDVGTLAGWREAMLGELLRDPALRDLARAQLDD